MIKRINIRCRKLVLGIAGTGVIFAQVNASEPQDLLEILRNNGTITVEQYQQLREQEIKEYPSVSEKESSIKTRFGKTGGLTWKDKERGLELELGGRIFFDAVSYNEDNVPLGSGTELRTARISLKGSVAEDWKFKAQYDFAENELSVKDVYFRYSGVRHLGGVSVGHFKEPFSLEDQTSSKNITFMERSLPVDAFSPGRAVGLGIDQHGNSWNLSAGLFSESVGDDPDDENNEGWGIAGRGTLSLDRGDRHSLHLGAAGEYRQPDTADEVRFRAGPESHLTAVSLVNTGVIDSVDHRVSLGLEAAVVAGPVSLQAEYIQAQVQRQAGNSDLDFDGWYIYGSWFLTGESRPYNRADGAFDRLIPSSDSGAWELGLRLSMLDLNSEDVLGGEAESATFGLNWYVNPRIRFMANFIQMDTERRGVNDDPDIIQLRSQFVF